MSCARYLIGDTRTVVESLRDGSIDLVLTSPPFLALRSYLPADHPDKHLEIGSEPTPADFLDTLLDLTELWRRKLAPHGSIVVELGDTYSGSGGHGGDYNPGGLRDGQPQFDGAARAQRRSEAIAAGVTSRPERSGYGTGTAPRPARVGRRPGAYRNPDIDGGALRDRAVDEALGIRQSRRRVKGELAGWPLDKSICGIPWLYSMSLAYGRNLLRPEHTLEPWRVRNVIVWCRPNPPVGALGDKFRPATSFLTVATVERDRWFDLDAVRGDPADVKDERRRTTNGPKQGADPREVLGAGYGERVPSHPGGAPPLDWWEIPTESYSGSHYATWPRKLLTRPIEAMCPRRVCTTCGEPSRRLAETTNGTGVGFRRNRQKGNERSGGASIKSTAERVTLGWTDCGHDTWRNGVVLDPFAGSGTTLAVATGLGRDAIGVDLDERNAHLARERVGMFLEVEHPEAVA